MHEITEGYDFNTTLRTIELYDNDRFITGNKDELDREKPFFNIVSLHKNVATRATDLDTKDVQIQSDRITSPATPPLGFPATPPLGFNDHQHPLLKSIAMSYINILR